VTVQPVPSAPSSDLVITYFGWWDCPRGGIVTEDGHPHYFRSDFSEELDDYDPVFRLWPVPDEALERELRFWDLWVAWRASFDRGERPSPIDQQEEFRRLSDELRSFRVPPQDALMAIPHWELDRDRSFAVHAPKHRVQWNISPTDA